MGKTKKQSSVSVEELRETVKTPLVPGECAVIMTVTLYYIGMVIEVTPDYVLLGGASMVFQIYGVRSVLSGKEKITSVEVLPDEGCVQVERGAIVASFPWNNPLPVYTPPKPGESEK